MRYANLLTVANTSDPMLAHVRKLARIRSRAETMYRKAVAEERAEIARLLDSELAGPVAIAAAIGRTREAVRLSLRQWRKDHPGQCAADLPDPTSLASG